MSTYEDQANTYAHAGPGYKRRERLNARPKTTAEVQPKPEHRLNQNPGQEEPRRMSGRNVRQKIIKLTLEIGSFGAIVDRLEQEQYGDASKVLVSNIRDHTLTVLRVIMAEGLITEKALNRYRATAKEKQQKRFTKRERLDDDD